MSACAALRTATCSGQLMTGSRPIQEERNRERERERGEREREMVWVGIQRERKETVGVGGRERGMK